MCRKPCIGVIGVGQIGARMARRIAAAGYDVVVHDIDPATAAGLPGMEFLASSAEVAARAETIITCVTDGRAVRDVVEGPDGILQRTRPGQLVIETTTSSPDTTRALGNALRRWGAEMVDAPVSRGVPAAEAGTLSVMLGGEVEAKSRALEVLSVLGTDIVETGALGTGHIAKALNMMVMGVNFVAVAEVMELAAAMGIAPGACHDTLTAGTGGNFLLDNHWPKYILPGSFDSNFTQGLMLKDMGIAFEIARGNGQFPVIADGVLGLYRWAHARGMSDDDNTRLVAFIESIGDAGKTHARHDSASPVGVLGMLDRALAASIAAGTLEAAAVGQCAGLPADSLLDVLNVSSGGSVFSARGLGTALEPVALRDALMPMLSQATAVGTSHGICERAGVLLGLLARCEPGPAPASRLVDAIGHEIGPALPGMGREEQGTSRAG